MKLWVFPLRFGRTNFPDEKKNHLLVLCVSPLIFMYHHFDIVLYLYLLSRTTSSLKAVLTVIIREIFVLYLFVNLTRRFFIVYYQNNAGFTYQHAFCALIIRDCPLQTSDGLLLNVIVFWNFLLISKIGCSPRNEECSHLNLRWWWKSAVKCIVHKLLHSKLIFHFRKISRESFQKFTFYCRILGFVFIM